MNIVWISGKPHVEDDRYSNGFRELSPYELEQEKYHD
jgi:hypothetical protein